MKGQAREKAVTRTVVWKLAIESRYREIGNVIERTIDILYELSGKEVLNMRAVTYESDGIEGGNCPKSARLTEPFSSSSVIHQNLHAKREEG